MTTYVALLRGINVGGNAKIPMARLRASVAGLGFADVRTYIQTGNVIFGADATGRAGLTADIERVIRRDFELEVAVMVRDAAELAAVRAANPFADRDFDPAKLAVWFLTDPLDADQAAALTVPESWPEELSAAGSEIFVYYPDGMGRSKLTNSFVERRLGTVAATARNWRTVLKLCELTAG